MGLDISHGCWQGAYSKFERWRKVLAEAAGYPIGMRKDMEIIPTYLVDEEYWTWPHLEGIWEKTPRDPLLVLLVHSDCDGHIAYKQLPSLAARLEELVTTTIDPTYHNITWQFIEGLQWAIEKKEPITFC